MRKRKLIVLLILVLLIIVLLKCCGGKEKKTADDLPKTGDPKVQETIAPAADVSDASGGADAEDEDGIIVTRIKNNGTEEKVQLSDVARDSWYADAVNYVVSMGLMGESSDGTSFRPEYGIQRVELAIALYRFAGGTEETPRVRFGDVSEENWFSKYVAWVTNHGYMNGKDGESFDPFGYLSCEKALIVLYRLAGEPKVKGTLESYPYAPKVSDLGRNAVTWAWNTGLITEKECVWYPTQTISRAQVALLIARYNALFGKP